MFKFTLAHPVELLLKETVIAALYDYMPYILLEHSLIKSLISFYVDWLQSWNFGLWKDCFVW